MKPSLLTILVTIFLLPLLSGCAVSGNSPAKKTQHEVLATPGFKVSSGEWFKVSLFEAYVAAKKLDAPLALQDQHEADVRSLKPMQVQMVKEIKKKQAAFYALYFRIDSGVNINFQRGGLMLTLRDPQGNAIEVPDEGCLFVYYEGTKATLYDSAKGSVRFNRDFNNKPDYSKIGNLVCVRLPPKYENWELIALKLEPQKVSMLQ
jgi:hypothetical protein